MDLEEMGSFFNKRADIYEEHMMKNVDGADRFYIQTDYMAPNQEFEDYHFSENKRIRKELGIADGFYHYDTPCTVENEIKLLNKAGFKSVEKVWQHTNTAILLAKK